MSDTAQGGPGDLRARVLSLLVSLGIGLPGCASAPLPGFLAPGTPPEAAPQAATPQASTGWKQVAEKRVPFYLVALDGTECTVSRARFDRVERGDRILCTWR